MPGKNRSMPVRTRRPTRTVMISARRRQILTCAGNLARLAPKASVCSGTGWAPGLRDVSAVSCAATGFGEWAPEAESTGASERLGPCGSGTCFIADTTDRQYYFRSFRITFNF